MVSRLGLGLGLGLALASPSGAGGSSGRFRLDSVDPGVDLSQHLDHRIFGVGDLGDRLPRLDRALEGRDPVVEESQRFSAEPSGVGAGSRGLLGLGPASFDEQRSLLGVGGDGLPVFGRGRSEKLVERCLRLVEQDCPFVAVGLLSADGDQGCRPAKGNFPLELCRGGSIAGYPLEDGQGDVGHLPLIERVEQPPGGDVDRGFRRVGRCRCHHQQDDHGAVRETGHASKPLD